MNIEQIIDATVNKTVLKLKIAGLMKDEQKSAFQKTEELLKNYNNLKMSGEPKAKLLIKKIDEALQTIKDDPYYEVIYMYYFEQFTREYIAEDFNTTVTTISRNKRRLIDKLKVILFSDEYIYEIYS